jgi:hypothetical protein
MESFYHQLVRKYHIAFGSVFKELTLLRNESLNNTGAEAQRFVVPIEYSARDSWLARLRHDPDLNRKDSLRIPRLAYEMTGMHYDPARKLNGLNTRFKSSYEAGGSSLRRYFVGTPYILNFNLYAITRSIEDANQFIEQIVPYFTPYHSLLLKLIPSIGILDRMRMVLQPNSPTWVDNYEQGFETTREIVLTFTFDVSSTLYGPIAGTPSNIIRKVLVDLYASPYDSTLTGPVYVLSDSLDRLLLEDESGRLLDDSSESDLRELARVARIQIEPDPLNAAPVKPVDTTTTITEYDDGKVSNAFTGNDEDIDIAT